ncbi:MAG: NAD(P)/FAD-dependent oxidoreductase [Fimbriimonadaceae bacterium]|nr:NAD(P)/FAD-dependent oxidoreductase [Fimbriimonadaceae bacterium]
MRDIPDVLVVGAGAAGIVAAWRAASLGARVLLLEKTPRIGTKILISGGGKCNVCHDGPMEEVLKGFRPNEARFLRPSFYRFSNQDLLRLLTDRGLRVYTRPNGRVFPVDQTAKDVVAILAEVLAETGVEVRRATPVRRLSHQEGRVTGVETAEGAIPCERVVVSTGGSSYPNSGTTGDGYRWARDLGHTVVPVRAALAPIYLRTDSTWADLSGVSLRDVVLRARKGDKVLDRWRDDLLFTHHGVSGPTALEVSRAVAEAGAEGVSLDVDLLPDRTPEQVAEWALELATTHPRKRLRSLLDGIVPERLTDRVLIAAKAEGETPLGQVDRKTRNRLLETLKRWPIGEARTVPLEKGEVVAGGIALDEVDPKTMRSLRCEGLYLCGEVLDVAGRVGGYNLQAAWSTGFVAGETAARDAETHAGRMP